MRFEGFLVEPPTHVGLWSGKDAEYWLNIYSAFNIDWRRGVGGARSQVLLTCVPDFCRFSWEQKGRIDRSRGQIRRQIAALASFPWWQALTVASPADLSGYRCLISPAQGSG